MRELQADSDGSDDSGSPWLVQLQVRNDHSVPGMEHMRYSGAEVTSRLQFEHNSETDVLVRSCAGDVFAMAQIAAENPRSAAVD
jgi:hypothetical protein